MKQENIPKMRQAEKEGSMKEIENLRVRCWGERFVLTVQGEGIPGEHGSSSPRNDGAVPAVLRISHRS